MSLPDYPFTGRFAPVRGGHMHYLDEGPAQEAPVIMLHGNPTWSFFFRRLVLVLRDNHRCIVPDHLGMGLSDKPADREYTLSSRVEDLESLLEYCGVKDNITLVLHDWGGMIGMAWAHRFPERVRRLVIMNTAAFHPPETARLPWQLRLARSPLLGPLLVQGLNLFCRGAADHCVARAPLPPAVRAGYLAPYDSWRHRRAVLHFVQDIPLLPADPAWQVVTEVEQGLAQFADRPALLCWGLRDFVFDRTYLDAWRERLPRAEVLAIEDAGHYLLEDAPEEIIPRIRTFFESHPL